MGSGQQNVEDPRTYPKERRARLPPNSGDTKLLLDAPPLPRNAAKDCPYYFWSGRIQFQSQKSHTKKWGL